jgi:hypothetical protein
VREVSTLHAQVNCYLPDEAGFVDMVRRWFERGLEVFPELVGQSEPGGRAEAYLVDQAPGSGAMSSSKYSARAWEARLNGLAARPMGLSIDISPKGDASPEAEQFASLSMNDEFGGEPGWVWLTVYAGQEGLGEWEAAAGDRWTSFLIDALGSTPVGYADISLDQNPGQATAFDCAMRRGFIDSLSESEEYLRGYSWVTVVAAGLARRLGGVEALTSTGAFAEVKALPSGDVFLQATPTPQEFDEDALRRVWVALAPVLESGLPRQAPGFEHFEVVLEDAADVK